ncbi:fatty acid desaturase-domain-containing protein [Aspergillus leporis]|uniref:Fatty acid desaturase-domain-containing protein n=1 Tax=Aspergillus leporis TaxID=41062 RepID=A0A5N5X4T8_9EURO|nr:fatty acid desaturase-domain-containing protein [Aspergillus leporis]
MYPPNKIKTANPQNPSLKALKDAIPPTCFQPSTTTSLAYLARDITYATIFFYSTTFIDQLPTPTTRLLAWTAYGFLQGCIFVGLWILAHECGHGAFSPHPWLNDTLGWTLHSTLLVPYFSWKITHARHHRYTNHMGKDTAFVPYTEAEHKARFLATIELLDDTPVMNLTTLAGHQIFGWPTYLLASVTAGKQSYPRAAGRMSHFDPLSGLFTPSQRIYVWISDVGLAAMGWVLVYLGRRIGLERVMLLYFMPYVWVNHWIVAITYLHHTHLSVPHYGPSTWTYEKGALSAIDRTSGFFGRHFFHEIIDFHVIHHLFPKITFYRAEEATRAVRPLLGLEYHERKDESFMSALLTTWRTCRFVSGGSDGAFHWGGGKMG